MQAVPSLNLVCTTGKDDGSFEYLTADDAKAARRPNPRSGSHRTARRTLPTPHPTPHPALTSAAMPRPHTRTRPRAGQGPPCPALTSDPDPALTPAQGKDLEIKKLSGTKFRAMLRAGDEIPEWFAFKSVVDVLRAEWK